MSSLFASSWGSLPASNSRTSPRVAWVPSIRDDRTASWIVKGASSTSGFLTAYRIPLNWASARLAGPMNRTRRGQSTFSTGKRVGSNGFMCINQTLRYTSSVYQAGAQVYASVLASPSVDAEVGSRTSEALVSQEEVLFQHVGVGREARAQRYLPQER